MEVSSPEETRIIKNIADGYGLSDTQVMENFSPEETRIVRNESDDELGQYSPVSPEVVEGITNLQGRRSLKEIEYIPTKTETANCSDEHTNDGVLYGARPKTNCRFVDVTDTNEVANITNNTERVTENCNPASTRNSISTMVQIDEPNSDTEDGCNLSRRNVNSCAALQSQTKELRRSSSLFKTMNKTTRRRRTVIKESEMTFEYHVLERGSDSSRRR